jgi:uncharacterized protein (DUF362 family)
MKSPILECIKADDISIFLKKIGLYKDAKYKRVAIKINLAKPPSVNNPKTDPILLRSVINFLHSEGYEISIIESANGYLEENIRFIGLGKELEMGMFEVVDLDNEMAEKLISKDGDIHWFPKCLKNFDIRIAIPSTSLRHGKIFSNNVKLFVGIVPRRYYQKSDQVGTWRAKIHDDLHRSIANIFVLLSEYAPFHFFINGGNTYIESQLIQTLPKYYISNNGCYLDLHLIRELGINLPDYLLRVAKSSCIEDG